MGTKKFVVDAMLGKLVKWLRILGCDVLSVSELGERDEALLRAAKLRKRILLTGDQQLFKRAWRNGVKARFVGNSEVTEALATLSATEFIPLRIDFNNTRCPECNHKLLETSTDPFLGKKGPSRPKTSMKSEQEVPWKINVPDWILRRYSSIYVCQNCGKAYWPGSHYLRMLRILIEAKKSRDKSFKSQQLKSLGR